MDLKVYYAKLREVESTITAPFVVVVSLNTPDGGKAGVKNEVSRAVAAKLVVESRARIATEEEAIDFFAGQEDARLEIEARIAAQRMHVVVMPQTESRVPKSPRTAKD